MTYRILPPSEWPRLAHTDIGPIVDQLPTSGGVEIMAVEDGDKIIAAWALLQIWHAEGLWIAPEYRGKPSAARHLWRGITQRLHAHGCSSVLTNAMTDDIRSLLGTAGALKMPGDLYLLPLKG